MCLDPDGHIVAVAGSKAAGPGPLVYVFLPSMAASSRPHAIPGDSSRSPLEPSRRATGLEDLVCDTAQGELYRARTDRRGTAKRGRTDMDVEFRHPKMREIADVSAPLVQIARGTTFAEGPVWDRRNRRSISPTSSRTGSGSDARDRDGRGDPSLLANADGMTIDHEGRLVVAGWPSRSVWRREADGSIVPLRRHALSGHQDQHPQRHRGAFSGSGAIYWTDGDGAFSASPGMESDDLQRYLDFNAVFRLSPMANLRPVITDFVFPNGLTFSPDETRLYVNDTRQSLVRVCST